MLNTIRSGRRLSRRRRSGRRSLLPVECLERRDLLTAAPLISEFVASNGGSLVDGHGETPDWIEIYNAGDMAVDLKGWHLTDDPNDLNKWTFPSVELLAGDYLVLFASGNDAPDPAGNLHTNFSLNAQGDYLALVQPDEETIVSQYGHAGADFPPQFRDISYGPTSQASSVSLIAPSAPAQYLAPVDSSLEGVWFESDFAPDATWTNGLLGGGFPASINGGDIVGTDLSTLMLGVNSSAYIRIPFPIESEETLEATDDLAMAVQYDDGFVAYLNGSEVARRNAPADVRWNSAASSAVEAGTVIADLRSDYDAHTPVAGQSSQDRIADTQGAGRWDFFGSPSQNPTQAGAGLRPLTFAITSNGVRTANSYIDPGQPFDLPAVNNDVLITPGSSEGAPEADELAVHPGNHGAARQFFVSRWTAGLGEAGEVRVAGSARELGVVCNGITFSIYVDGALRYNGGSITNTTGVGFDFESTVEQGSTIDFVVGNNGNWACDQSALSVSLTQGAAAEVVDLSGATDLLVVGDNVLAIQGLNSSASDPDFLIAPTLTGVSAGVIDMADLRYFLEPTPGRLNGVGTLVPGPRIAEVRHSPQVPSDSDDLVVTAQVDATGEAVDSATLHYRVMYGLEVDVPMVDDGSGADASAGDGLFTAVIPHAASLPGEMVRYYLTADDMADNTSRAPLFLDSEGLDQSPEYYGTVVADPTALNDLPKLDWFLQPGSEALAETRTGTRASLFYDGEFYDNVFVRRRGDASSAGYPKANFKFDFNTGHHFRFRPDERRVSEFNLNGTWSDKSYIRRVLAWETYAAAGSPYSISFPLRLEQNGSFFSVAVFVEQPDEDFLARQGLDPQGALYKMRSQLEAIGGGTQKKTRLNESTGDLQDLVNGVSPNNPNRTQYLYDNIDLPRMFNYLAASVIMHENDHMAKNYYVYRDTEGSGEWLMLPWDKDLTYGKNWDPTIGGVLNDAVWADNDQIPGRPSVVSPSHPLFGRSENQKWDLLWNRLIDAIYDDTSLRAMYLRRLRTVMDEFLQAPNSPPQSRLLERRIDELQAAMTADVLLDRAKWGNPYGQNQDFATALNVIRNDYLPRRRVHLYEHHSLNNPGFPDNAGIPEAQSAELDLQIGAVEFEPASGNQDEEFIQLVNSSNFAVDISGWRLTEAVDYTLRPGTVIPAGGSLYLSPDSAAFRARPTWPNGGQSLLVQGGYAGHLSSFGETIRLSNSQGIEVASLTYPGNPSDLQQALRVSEINYNPQPPSATEIAAGFDDNDHFEYIELTNISAEPINLAGARFVEGVEFVFPAAILQPGQFAVVVQNEAAFEARYGAGWNVIGQFDAGRLDNSGEPIKLEDSLSGTIEQFTYNDTQPWPELADGKGASLEIVDPSSADRSASSWRSSAQYGGSPGSLGLAAVRDIVVNEVLTHTDPPAVDAIELHNTTDQPVDISGWRLSDSCDPCGKFVIPAGTSVPAGGYIVFDESDFNPSQGMSDDDFSLNGAHGDEVFLLASDGAGQPIRFADVVEFGAAANGRSWGRFPNGGGRFTPLTAVTLGAANSGPRVGPVVVSEIMYHPPEFLKLDDPAEFEFVELLNSTAEAVELTGWLLREAIEFDVPDGLTLGPGQVLVVTPRDPTDPLNASWLEQFRQLYSLPGDELIVGGYRGRLDNGGDRLQLLSPDAPPTDEPDFVPRLLEDEVLYDDAAPWPLEADGAGASLRRTSPGDWGNLASNWEADGPTPGEVEQRLPTLVAVDVNPTDHHLVRSAWLPAPQDPPDRPSGPQPSSWSIQRSSLATVVLTFSEPVSFDLDALTLTNLGVDSPNEADRTIDLSTATLVSVGRTVTLQLDPNALTNGVYQLEVSDAVSDLQENPLDGDADGQPGGAFRFRGDMANGFYQLSADFNGDRGVSIFDFSTFSYWFGEATQANGGNAPQYADLNGDGGVTIFDFADFAASFGVGVVFPPAVAGASNRLNMFLRPALQPVTSLGRARVPELQNRITSVAGRPVDFIPRNTPKRKDILNQEQARIRVQDDALLALLAEWPLRKSDGLFGARPSAVAS